MTTEMPNFVASGGVNSVGNRAVSLHHRHRAGIQEAWKQQDHPRCGTDWATKCVAILRAASRRAETSQRECYCEPRQSTDTGRHNSAVVVAIGQSRSLCLSF